MIHLKAKINAKIFWRDIKIFHDNYMNIALNLAVKGLKKTSPHPLVGCVIVKDNEIVAFGVNEREKEQNA